MILWLGKLNFCYAIMCGFLFPAIKIHSNFISLNTRCSDNLETDHDMTISHGSAQARSMPRFDDRFCSLLLWYVLSCSWPGFCSKYHRAQRIINESPRLISCMHAPSRMRIEPQKPFASPGNISRASGPHRSGISIQQL